MSTKTKSTAITRRNLRTRRGASVGNANEKGAASGRSSSGAMVGLFTDDERNALMTALQRAARAAKINAPKAFSHTAEFYLYADLNRYLEITLAASLVDQVVDQLHRLGWRIQPNMKSSQPGQ